MDRSRCRPVLTYAAAREDDALVLAGVGRVTSNTIELAVTTPASARVSRRGAEASLELTPDGGAYVVRSTNRSDQTAFVNGNRGSTPPFAQGRCVCDRDRLMCDVGVIPNATMRVLDFERQSLVEVKRGDTVELARIDRAELHKRLTRLGLDADHGHAVRYFIHADLCDRSWRMRQNQEALSGPAMPPVLRQPVPRRMVTGWHTSTACSSPEAPNPTDPAPRTDSIDAPNRAF